MDLRRTTRRRAFSGVLSALLLSGVVIAVGGAIWAFSQGAMTITAEDYAESVINMTDTISERFIVEQVIHNGTHIFVWIFNYGDVDIEAKVNIGVVTFPDNWIDLASGEMLPVDPFEFTVSSGDDLNIRVYSRRGNNAYFRYLVPS